MKFDRFYVEVRQFMYFARRTCATNNPHANWRYWSLVAFPRCPREPKQVRPSIRAARRTVSAQQSLILCNLRTLGKV